ncbi:MAG: hypothetical protein D9C04_04925 [Nitrosopumilus sp. B06]|nr:MAG: hypothetical protein D9C04_04925 [Nitrosopumilus sp. B06]
MVDFDSGKKNLLIFVGAFVVVGIIMSTVVFPFWNLIREDVYEETVILSNDAGTCYVETFDEIPKTIRDCTNLPGDTVTIKFGRGLAWATVTDP